MEMTKVNEVTYLAIVNDEGGFLEDFKLKDGLLAPIPSWGFEFYKAKLIPSAIVRADEKGMSDFLKFAQAVGGKLVELTAVIEARDVETGAVVELIEESAIHQDVIDFAKKITPESLEKLFSDDDEDQ